MAESERYTHDISYKLEAGIAVLVLVQTIGVFLWMNPPYWNMVRAVLFDDQTELKQYDDNNEVSFEEQTNDSQPQMEEKEEAHSNTINYIRETNNSFEANENIDALKQQIAELSNRQLNHITEGGLAWQNPDTPTTDEITEELYTKLEHLGDALVKSSSKVNELTKSNQELKKTNQELTAIYTNKLNDSEDEINKFKKQLLQKGKECKKLRTKLSQDLQQLNEKVINDSKQIIELKKINEELSAKCEFDSKEINALVDGKCKENKYKILETELIELKKLKKDEMNKLEQEIKILKVERTNGMKMDVQNEPHQLPLTEQKNYKELETELNELKEINNQLEMQLNEFKKVKQSNENMSNNEINKLKQQIEKQSDFNGENDELKQQLQEQRTENEELKSELETLKEMNKVFERKLDKNLKESNEKMREHLKQMNELKKLNLELENKLNGNGADILNLKKTNSQLTTKTEQLQFNKENQINEIKIELKVKEAQIISINKKYKLLENEKKKIFGECNELKKEVDKVRKQKHLYTAAVGTTTTTTLLFLLFIIRRYLRKK